MTERTAGKDDLPLASVMGAGSSPVVAESLLETAVANISSCAAPSSAPGSRADVTVNATASGSEVVPRAEDAEPSQEAAQADGSRSDPFVMVDPVPAGNATVAKTPDIPVGEDEDAARATREATVAGSAKSVSALEAHTLGAPGGFRTLSGVLAEYDDAADGATPSSVDVLTPVVEEIVRDLSFTSSSSWSLGLVLRPGVPLVAARPPGGFFVRCAGRSTVLRFVWRTRWRLWPKDDKLLSTRGGSSSPSPPVFSKRMRTCEGRWPKPWRKPRRSWTGRRTRLAIRLARNSRRSGSCWRRRMRRPSRSPS